MEKEPGIVEESSKSREINYSAICGNWTVAISIYMAKESIDYNQQVHTIEQGKRYVLGGAYIISLPQWVGFHNDSTWCFTSEEDASTAVDLIVSRSRDFINALPELISHIPPFRLSH